ncbi:MAG: hypothetical protein K940chlam2_01753 [Chlamydiae bacterium]|nr:hypothetical protein [Chlamydiota bacterium]
MIRAYLFLLLLCSTAFATNQLPWFGNVWEFEWRPGYTFYQGKSSTVPNEGSRVNQTLSNSLALTVWPQWNIETELLLTHTLDIDFAYEAFLITGRYQWLDDVVGDPIALTTGATASFPGNRFTHLFHFFYPGDINIELHTALGKQWPIDPCNIWAKRVWGYAAIGFANRGSPWLRARLAYDQHFSKCGSIELFTHYLYGWGSDSLPTLQPFTGFSSIAYRALDLGAAGNYRLGVFGTFSLEGTYNLYAEKYPEHSYAIKASLLIPFSL